ncbi:MAG: RNA polymerase sigma factor [Anaerolineae bacterium]|nr:RNA polymerase sigma factor [Anaerolineae bacterium]
MIETQTLPLDQLNEAIAADLDASFEYMVLAFQDRLYRFALRLTDNPQDAEEIAQDAFVRAYKALSSYSPERRLTLAIRPWLYQIALNVFRNRVRTPHPPTDSLEADEIEISDASEDRPEQRATISERDGELARQVAELPRHYREVLVLHYVEDLTFLEIADLLDQPLGTVKSKVSRGIDLLRRKLTTPATTMLMR